MKVKWVAAVLVIIAIVAVALYPRGRGRNDGGNGERPGAGPNVIVILIDALRRDHLGCYGYTRETSPTIDAFSEEAVTFLRAIAPSSWTKPSIPSLLTSLYPSHHGVFEGSSKDTQGHVTSDILSDSLVTMAEVFQAQGYATAGFVQNAQLKGFLGFSQGFDVYQDRAGNAGEINGSFEAWLDANGDKPFFAYLHYLDVHWPYQPPEPYDKMFGDYPSSIDFGTGEWKALRDRINDGGMALSSGDIEKMISLYDGELRYLDDRLAELFAALRERGIYDRSVIVVTADHGEEFLEHGKIGHGHALNDVLLRIPLLIRFPGGEWKGKKVADLVGLVDLLPTLNDYLGWKADFPSDGQGLMPLVASGESDGSPLRAAYSERLHGEEYQRAVIQGPYKLIETYSGSLRKAGRTGPLEHIQVGDRVEIAGLPGRQAYTLVAARISLDDNQDDDDDELEGSITGNGDGEEFELMGLRIEPQPGLKVKGLHGEEMRWADVKSGLRVKVNGHVQAGHRFEIDRVDLKDSGSEKYKIEGLVQGLEDRGADSTIVSMMGCRIIVNPQTEVAQGGPAGHQAGGEVRLEKVEFFDLGEDPGEKHDLAPTHAEVIQGLQRLMNEEFPSIVTSPAGSSPHVQELDQKTVEELKAIGYVE